jgi:hypothetical protein
VIASPVFFTHMHTGLQRVQKGATTGQKRG